MKPILFLLLIVIIFSCKKEKVQTLQDKVNGKWELSRRWGTIAGIDESYSTGNGIILEFAGNNFYRYVNTQLTQSGIYTIAEDTTSFIAHGARISFRVNIGSRSEKFVRISDTALVFSDYGTDAEHSQYRRLQ